MICPKCKKPYFFMDAGNAGFSKCLSCKYKEPFEMPIYENYHEDLYAKKPYIRTIKTDPQLGNILRKLDIKAGDRVLDIGCGVGDYTSAIYSQFSKQVTGVDLDITEARKKYPALDFISHDLADPLPFPDDGADVIVSINCIEHLADYQHFLRECRRVLKKNGLIAITTANLDFFLHNYFFDKTHVHEWTLEKFREIVGDFFSTNIAEKSSSMFKYYPFNLITTKFLKPDLLAIAKNDKKIQ